MEFLHNALQVISTAEIFYLTYDNIICAYTQSWENHIRQALDLPATNSLLGENIHKLLKEPKIQEKITTQLRQIVESEKETTINIPISNTLFIWSISPWKYQTNENTNVGFCILQCERSFDKCIPHQDDDTAHLKTVDFILESVYDGYWDWYVQENYQYMSPKFWEMFGYTSSEKKADPKEWMEIMFKEDLERAMELLEKHTKSRGEIPYTFEGRFKHRNGHTVHVLCKGKVIKWNADGSPNRMIGTHTEVTNLRAMQQDNIKLQLEKEKYEEVSKIKSSLLAKLSHEIRTPLHGIMGIGSMIENSKSLSKAKSNAALLLSNCESLLTVLNDVLQMCQLESYTEEKSVGCDTEIIGFLKGIVGLFAYKAKEKGNSLTTQIDLSYNGQTYDVAVCDKNRIRQVLFNLTNNAIKFTSSGKIVLQFHIDDVKKTDKGEHIGVLHFSVKDSGIGIAEEYHSKIFDPFVQVDSEITRKYSGSGLGLSISKEIVEGVLAGKLGVHSSLGNGACFYFSVPNCVVYPSSSGLPAVSKEQQEPVSENEECKIIPRWDRQFFQTYDERIHPISVLIVDDNRMNRFILRNIVKSFMKLAPRAISKVTEAADGKSAVDTFMNGTYDVVFMDLHMPEMDGFDASKQIRCYERESKKRPDKATIVAVTADSFLDTKNNCLECGMDSFLSKPFAKEKIYLLLTQSCLPLD